MFRIFMIIGWVALLVLLLYIWADVREIAAVVKDSKRELIRSNFGGRTSGRPQEAWKESGVGDQPQPKEAEGQPNPWAAEAQPKPWEKVEAVSLKASEEQILQEVLTEFLG